MIIKYIGEVRYMEKEELEKDLALLDKTYICKVSEGTIKLYRDVKWKAETKTS